MSRSRLDQEMVRRRLSVSRSGARNAIRDGQVVVDGQMATRPAQNVPPGADIEVDPAANRYVGRGAHKLDAALTEFAVVVAGRTALDVGASTGGFTDVLLGAGASRVAAVDVGQGQLHERLRSDPRVTVHEGVNIRHADLHSLGAPFGLVVADLSFISLGVVAGVLAESGSDDSDWLVLVKPQFEVGPDLLGSGGVVRSAAARGQAVVNVAAAFAAESLIVVGAIASPITGGSGNKEALLWLRRGDRAERSALAPAELYRVLNYE